MAAQRKIPTEGRALILWVARIRRDIPSDKDLARLLGCSVSAVQKIVQRAGELWSADAVR